MVGLEQQINVKRQSGDSLSQKRKRMFARQQEILAQYSMEVMA